MEEYEKKKIEDCIYNIQDKLGAIKAEIELNLFFMMSKT